MTREFRRTFFVIVGDVFFYFIIRCACDVCMCVCVHVCICMCMRVLCKRAHTYSRVCVHGDGLYGDCREYFVLVL